MSLFLLDLLLGDLVLCRVGHAHLQEVDRLERVRLDGRDRVQMVAAQEPHGPHDLVDPIWHLTHLAMQREPGATAVQRALGPIVADWLRPRLASGDRLLVLFQPGMPDAFRQSLLEDLGRLSHPRLVAGVSLGLLALWGDQLNRTESTTSLGSPRWRMEAISRLEGPQRRSLASLRWQDDPGSWAEHNLLAQALVAGAEWLEGDRDGQTLEVDLQPRLQVRRGSDGTLELGELEPGVDGAARLTGLRPGWLWLGCGRGGHWSGADPLAALPLELRGSLDLDWVVDPAMRLELSLRGSGQEEPLVLRRQLPRPLLVTVNRLGLAGAAAADLSLDSPHQWEEHAA
jgi:hypothetical protein